MTKSDVTHVDFENGRIIIDTPEALIEWFGHPMPIQTPEPKQLGVVRVEEDSDPAAK